MQVVMTSPPESKHCKNVHGQFRILDYFQRSRLWERWSRSALYAITVVLDRTRIIDFVSADF